MRINVTQKDIENGQYANPAKCPVALAISRATKAEASVTSHYVDIYGLKTKVWLIFTRKENRFGIPLSNRVGKWIRNFDISGRNDPSVKPFSFDLNLKDHLVPHG